MVAMDTAVSTTSHLTTNTSIQQPGWLQATTTLGENIRGLNVAAIKFATGIWSSHGSDLELNRLL